MKIIVNLVSAFVMQALGLAAMSYTAIAQDVIINTPQEPTTQINTPQEPTTQRICSSDPVSNLLPALESNQSNPLLAYLAQEGFIQSQEGA